MIVEENSVFLLLSSSWEGELGWKPGDDSISSKMLGGQQKQQAGVVQHYHEEVYHQPITSSLHS